MDQISEERIKEMKARLLGLLTVPQENRNDSWERCVKEVKKGIEIVLYNFVRNGCTGGYNRGRYPELSIYYDPDSDEKLDEKIKILGAIAKNPDCSYQNIEGFKDILEKIPPEGEQLTGFVD